MTWWANPTPDLCTVRLLDDDNAEHVYLVKPGEVTEIPGCFDRGIQYRWSPGSPLLGVAPMLVRVDDSVVAEAQAEVIPEVVLEVVPAPEETRPDTSVAKAAKAKK